MMIEADESRLYSLLLVKLADKKEMLFHRKGIAVLRCQDGMVNFLGGTITVI